MYVGLARGHQLPPAVRVFLRRDFFEGHTGQLAVFVRERLRNEIVVDRDAFVHRVFFFPRRRFHLLETRTYDDVDLLAAQATRTATAIHCRVTAAHHDDALADRLHMAERDRRQPIDADMNVRRGLAATRNVDVAPARRTAADEHRVEWFRQQRAHRIDP